MPTLSKPQTSKNFPGGSEVKNLLANARDAGLISGSGKSPEKEMATSSSILVWKIPSVGEPGSYSLWDHKVGHVWAIEHPNIKNG